MLRFSGHDTFHCKEQWILKGTQLAEEQEGGDVFKLIESISKLGVGKNMVRSIQHWLRAFGLINSEGKPLSIAKLLFLEGKLDPYLENQGSLWLLQYNLCKCNYASIFKIVFSDYFSDKATLEFSESQINKYILRSLEKNEQKIVADKTLEADYKVFIRSYISPTKNHKTVEDDFNVPLIPLNLISDTKRLNEKGQKVYRINKSDHDVPSEIFIYCLLEEFENEVAISFNEISKTVGSYLCLSNDKVDEMLSVISENFVGFAYKDDAGIRQLQIKNNNLELKIKILKEYYESY